MTGIIKFLTEIAVELVRVRWPNRKDLVVYTIIVMVTVFVASVIISAMDASSSYLIKNLISF